MTRAGRAIAEPWAAAGAAAAIAAVLALLYDGGQVNYDSSYALLWGQQLADGTRPDYATTLTPTPKPLGLALGLLLVPLGEHAAGALQALCLLALAATAVLAHRLGTRLSGRPAGLVAAALVLTREPMLSFGTRAYLDVVFVALVLGALLAELRASPRPHLTAALLLAAAGLIRPEAWLLGAALLAWHWRGLDRRQRLLAGLVAAAPAVVWVGSDWVVTTDPLWSLRGTQANVEALNRPTGPSALVSTAPRRLAEIVREPVLLLAPLGALLLWRGDSGGRLVLGSTALALVAFALMAAAGLPVISRYLLLPAVLACILAAIALTHALTRPATPRRWRAMSALGVLVLLALAPGQLQRLGSSHRVLSAQATMSRDLTALLSVPAAQMSCAPMQLPNHRVVPDVARSLGRPLSTLRTTSTSSGAYLQAATPRVARLFALDRADTTTPLTQPPVPSRVVAQNRSWRLLEACDEHTAPH